MEEPELIERILYHLKEDNLEGVKELISSIHPSAVAHALELFEQEERTKILGLLDAETASEILLELEGEKRKEILEELHHEKIADIVEELDSDDAADLIAELPKEKIPLVLQEIPPEDVEDIKILLKYDEDTAGGIMQTELVQVTSDATVRDTINWIRLIADEVEDFYEIYVTDEEDILLGMVPLRKLILANPTTQVKEIMDAVEVEINPHLDQEEVANIFKKYDVVSLPVVDGRGRLLGRITADDIMDVITEEASEDLYRLAGVDEEERVLSSPWGSLKGRLPWLYVSLGSALVSAYIIGFFEESIKAVVILAVFMPIIAAVGGSAGIQTLTIVVRGIALGEISGTNYKKVISRQLGTALLNGFVLGIAMAVVAYLWQRNTNLSLVLWVSMIANCFVGGFAGTFIPLTLKWLKIDPAVASNVFVTLLTDSLGYFTFLGLSTMLLRYIKI